MDRDSLKGSSVAIVTPFRKDEKIDRQALAGLVDWQIAEGTRAIVVAGTTGEAVTLSDEEHIELIALVVEQVAGRVPVVAGTGSNSTSKAIYKTRKAEEVGSDCVLSVGPYYNKPTQEGFYQHFAAIADCTSLPVVLYNVPGRTGSNITAETVLRLAEIKNIIGVKEASGNLDQVMQILRKRPEGFLVLSGDDAFTLPLVALGGDGVISVVANEIPGPFSQMVRAALEGDWDTARGLHYRYLSLMNLNFIESNPIPVKTALAMMGRIEERFRLPLVPISDSNRSKLRTALEELALV